MKPFGTRPHGGKRRWTLALLMLAAAAPAFAQISNFTAVKNAGNSPDELVNGSFISYQRISAVSVSASDTVATARYAGASGTDTGLLSNWTEVLNADYTVTFDVTAPGAYDLLLTTSISGAFTLVNDGDAAATASATAVTYTGDPLASGDLGLAAPGSFTSNTGGDVPFERTNAAQIHGVSNGVPQTHTFRFTWTMTCALAPGGFSGADECAVRLGLPLTFAGQTAGAYPGVGSRAAELDGHFFTVNLVSLCGDGVVQADRGEACDAGADNGQPGSCCSSSCQLLEAGEVCRPEAGACDVAETCDGVGDDCPDDVLASSDTVCRPAAGACDVAESCSGSSPECPADAVSDASVTCRPAAGDCDVAEQCDGVNAACPADAFEPATTVCRPSSGTCDVAETCTGTGTECPADTGGADADGDSVCDGDDNCQSIPNPGQENADGDLFGDACDPCTNLAPTVQEKATLTLSNLLTPASDDKLAFSSFFTGVPASPAIDPVQNGVRFLIVDATGATPVDVTIPGGVYDPGTKSGWKANAAGTAWTYKNAGSVVPLVNGINKVAIKAVAKTPGKYKTQVKGKNGLYPVDPGKLPLVATFIVDPPFASSGQCGEAMFPAPAPARPSCVAASGGKTVRCK
jgi:hypothetical protein